MNRITSLALLVLSLLVIGCQSNKSSMLGHFKSYEKGRILELTLKPDEFTLKKGGRIPGIVSYGVCVGQWKLENKKVIKLRCKEASVAEILRPTHMSQRNYEIIYIDSNNLKLDTILLKRVDEKEF